MSMIGGDAAAIRLFGQRLAARREQIETTQRRMSALVEAIPWEGADRERFLHDWHSVHEPNLARMALDLGSVVDEAHRAAAAQDQASGAW